MNRVDAQQTPPHPRPADGLPALAAALGQGQAGPLRRARAVGGAQDGRASARTRSKPSSPRSTGCSAPASKARRRRRSSRRLHQIEGKKARGREPRAGDRRSRPRSTSGKFVVATIERKESRQKPAAAVHHQPPAAGGRAPLRLLGQAHDGHRAGPLRRQGHRRSRPDRPHHLHAYRLDARRRRGDRRRCASTSRRPTARIRCPSSPTSTSRRRTRRTPTKRSARRTFDLPPDAVAQYLEPDDLKLYRLIWERFVASQMLPAVFDVTQVDVASGIYTLRATGRVMKFPGFLALYQETAEETRPSADDEAPAADLLPPLTEGEALKLIQLEKEQKFTQPPAQFSEATLVKALEENGIGRPSTYASILSTLSEREYAEKVQGRFNPIAARPGGQPAPAAGLQRHHQRVVHRRHGAQARRDRRRPGAVEDRDRRVRRQVHQGLGDRRREHAERQARGHRDRRGLPAVRLAAAPALRALRHASSAARTTPSAATRATRRKAPSRPRRPPRPRPRCRRARSAASRWRSSAAASAPSSAARAIPSARTSARPARPPR